MFLHCNLDYKIWHQVLDTYFVTKITVKNMTSLYLNNKKFGLKFPMILQHQNSGLKYLK
jgi:hypothetical protein